MYVSRTLKIINYTLYAYLKQINKYHSKFVHMNLTIKIKNIKMYFFWGGGDSEQSAECIGLTMCFSFYVCKQLFYQTNAPIFECSTFSETILGLVGALEK